MDAGGRKPTALRPGSASKKMRLWPATRAAFARGMFCLLFSPRKGDEVAFTGRIPDGTLPLAAAANPGFAASESRRIGPAEARLFGRPQRPGYSESAEASPKFSPPAIHPREPPVYRLPLLFQQRLRTSHACTGSTVRHSASERNKELRSCCAEAVEEEDSLWKQKENASVSSAGRRHYPSVLDYPVISRVGNLLAN